MRSGEVLVAISTPLLAFCVPPSVSHTGHHCIDVASLPPAAAMRIERQRDRCQCRNEARRPLSKLKPHSVKAPSLAR
eukprot:1335534-Rhodomonas_salina.2